MTKLYEAGEPNELLHSMIRHNVRTPDAVFGDLAAQVSSGRVGSERLLALCERHGLDDIEQLAEEIINRSETATRNTIKALKAGTYHGETTFDAPGGEEMTLKVAVTVDTETGEILLDFRRLVRASPRGINVVLNYTHAYATFAVRACLNPDLPNNYGSLAPIRIAAPEGCIVNAKYPVSLNARHVVGMYVPFPIIKALYQVVPDKVLAEGAGAIWTVQIQGTDLDGMSFTSTMFNYSGGMGARREKDGPSATCYPTGVAAVPIETLEAAMPIEFTRKQLRPGSGGKGRPAAATARSSSSACAPDRTWLLNMMPSRVTHAPEGLEGGEPGETGIFHINGADVSDRKKLDMEPDDLVTMYTPGGGGYGPPDSQAAE